jgi:hypothetical protein
MRGTPSTLQGDQGQGRASNGAGRGSAPEREGAAAVGRVGCVRTARPIWRGGGARGRSERAPRGVRLARVGDLVPPTALARVALARKSSVRQADRPPVPVRGHVRIPTAGVRPWRWCSSGSRRRPVRGNGARRCVRARRPRGDAWSLATSAPSRPDPGAPWFLLTASEQLSRGASVLTSTPASRAQRREGSGCDPRRVAAPSASARAGPPRSA